MTKDHAPLTPQRLGIFAALRPAVLWLAARSPRERAGLLLAQGLVVLACWSSVLLPGAERNRALPQQIAMADQELALTRQILDHPLSRADSPADPVLRRKALLAQQGQLERSAESMAEELRRLQSAPLDVPTLRASVSELLAQHPGLTLVAMTVAPPVSAGTAPAMALAASAPLGPGASVGLSGPSTPQAAPVQRYDVQITLDGGYLGLMTYLSDLELRLPQARWSTLRLTSTVPGTTRMTLAMQVLAAVP